jgi:hypothetical protein
LSGVPLDDPWLNRRLLDQLGEVATRVCVDPPSHRLGVDDETILELIELMEPLRGKASEAEWALDLRPLEASDMPGLGASRLARAFIRLQSAGMLLGLRLDGPTGLLDAVDDPYNAFYTMRLLATLFDGGFDPVENAPVFLEGDDLEQMTFRRADGSWLIAAWAQHRVDEQRAHLVIPPRRRATAYDTLTCTSQDLRVTEEDGRTVASSVMLRTYPTVFLVE